MVLKTKRVFTPASEPDVRADDARQLPNPSPASWAAFCKDLDGGNTSKLRRFAADCGIPFELLPALTTVRKEARRLEQIVGTLTDDPDEVEQLRAELILIQQAKPQTAEAAKDLAKQLVSLPKQIRQAEARQRDFEQATLESTALRDTFRELFDGEPGVALGPNGTLPLAVRNSLAKAGFGGGVLYHTPWREL